MNHVCEVTDSRLLALISWMCSWPSRDMSL